MRSLEPDARQLVIRLMDDAGSTLLLAMEPVSDRKFYAENADGLSAAWVVGHLACVLDLASSWFGKPRMCERSFHAVFNETAATEVTVSKASMVDPEKYPKALLLLLFNRAVVKAIRALDEFDITEWDAPGPPGVPVSLRTGGAVWEFLARHTDWHLGALSGSMPMFFGTFTLNIASHYFYDER